jgi:hypothetical protein
MMKWRVVMIHLPRFRTTSETCTLNLQQIKGVLTSDQVLRMIHLQYKVLTPSKTPESGLTKASPAEKSKKKSN